MRVMATVTFSRIAFASSWIATPYSAMMATATEAWPSSTATFTPCCTLVEDVRDSRTAPHMRAAPPPRLFTPETSRAAMPAILPTTLSSMTVEPWSVSRFSLRGRTVSGSTAVEVVDVVDGVFALVLLSAMMVLSEASYSGARPCPSMRRNTRGLVAEVTHTCAVQREKKYR